jgi:phosphomannomutase/phosphoglucomutase
VAQHPECLLQHAQLSEGHIQTIDGVRVDFKQGFGLVRASNTTPTVILRFEGNTQAALNTIMGQFKHVLIELEPGAQLPI